MGRGACTSVCWHGDTFSLRGRDGASRFFLMAAPLLFSASVREVVCAVSRRAATAPPFGCVLSRPDRSWCCAFPNVLLTD